MFLQMGWCFQVKLRYAQQYDFMLMSGVSLSFQVGGTNRRVAGQKITLEVNFFMFSLKVGRY